MSSVDNRAPGGQPTSVVRRRPCRRRFAIVLRLLAVASTLSLLAACAHGGTPQRLEPSGTPTKQESGVTYWSDARSDLKLDACLPRGTGSARRAVVLVHGGGFTDGDKSDPDMRSLCTLIAGSGVAAFAINYRLAPTYVYPAQVDDLGHAVEWLRQAPQVKRYRIDPRHIGVIGSSAGAIMAQTLGTQGVGPLDTGTRVSAVVSLSGVSVMTPAATTLGHPTPEAESLILTYLGCKTLQACPQASKASPITSVDKSDAPVLLVNGSAELVPEQQAQLMAKTLGAVKVAAPLVIVTGKSHGAALLDSTVRRDIQTFLDRFL